MKAHSTGLERLAGMEAMLARWPEARRVTVEVRQPNDELIAMLTGDGPVDWERARELGADVAIGGGK